MTLCEIVHIRSEYLPGYLPISQNILDFRTGYGQNIPRYIQVFHVIFEEYWQIYQCKYPVM